MASQLQRALRPHIPLIRFKYGLEHSGAKASSSIPAAAQQQQNQSPTHQPTGATSSKPAVKPVALEFTQTPKKYRRRPLTQDEIDLVTIGGKV